MSLAAADFSQIPMSQNLATTLARASDLANFMGAAEVALEHVLLALCDDPDAEAVLMASRVDVQHLKTETHGYLNGLPRGQPPAGFGVSQALSRILEAAAAAARGSRRRDINGAIVLAAIVGEGRSAAAQILQVHGLTFDEAIRALQSALAAPVRESLPDIRPADDVLARARERVQSRAAPGLRDMMRDAQRPAPPPPPQQQMAPQPAQTEFGAPAAPLSRDMQNADTAIPSELAIPSDNVALETERAAATGEDSIEMAASATQGAASESVERIEPTLPGGNREVEAHAAPAPLQQYPSPPPSPAPYPGPQPQQDYGYPGAVPSEPPRGAQPSAPGFPFDLQRPQPIALPPPIPQRPVPPGYRGGMPNAPGFPSEPNPSYAPQSQPMQQRPPAPPPFGAEPVSYPPMAPYDPQRPHSGPPMHAGPYGDTGAATAPAPPMSTQPPLKRQKKAKPQARTQIETGQLSENIPRAMRVGKTESIEVRIGKAAAKAITQGLEGGGVAWRHEVTVTQAMSVRLRAPDGGFFIETASPETQWIENNLGFGSDDFASWRFHITPQLRGWARLQIIVSARTIGNDGMAAETALPDQLVDVKVKTNYKRTFARWTGWTMAAIVGGILAKFGEGTFSVLSTLVEKFMK